MANLNNAAGAATKSSTKSEVLKGLVDSVATLEATTKGLSDKVSEMSQPVYQPHRTPGNLFGIVRGEFGKDSRPYSFLNLIKALKNRSWDNAKQEYGIHQELVRAGYQHEGGFLVPSDPDSIERFSPQAFSGIKSILKLSDAASQPDAYAKAMTEVTNKALSAFGSDILGGALIDTKMANSVIELLRAQVATVAAGATEIQLPPSGQYAWARQTQDPTFSWVGENTAIGSSDPAFGSILFSAKKAAALVFLSNDALLFTNPAIEVVVRQALAEKGARFEDSAFLEGTGGSYQPLGIINQTGLTTHTAQVTGTNGDTVQPEDVLNMIAKVEEANDMQGMTAFIMRPLMWSALANRRADSVTAGDGKGPFMFWTTRGEMANGVPKNLNGVPVITTTTVSNTRVKGSGTNLSYILGGNFKRAVIARTGTMEISALSSGEEFKADQTVIRAIMRLDFNLTHTKPFVFCDNLVVG